MVTINDVIFMKGVDNIPFGTQYEWLFLTIENDLVSKSNGSERVKQLLADYDEMAKAFIIYQFMHIGEEHIADELLSIFSLNLKEYALEDEHKKELLSTFE